MRRDMHYLILLVFSVAVCLLSGCDTPAGEQPAWMFVLEHAQGLLVIILTPVLVLLGKHLATLIAVRLHIERTQAFDDQIDVIIRRAIAYVDEQARKALHAGQPPADGPTKLREAAEAADRWIRQAKLPELAIAELERLIEAALGEESERPRFNTSRLGGEDEDDA